MIKNLLQEGFILKEKGHYKKAIEVFYKALAEDNTSSELLLEIAELYYKLGDEERSLEYIEQVLDKDPQHINALRLLEQIFIDKCALAQAEQTAKNIYCISNNDNDLAVIFKLLNLQRKFDEIFEYNIETSNTAVILEQAKALYRKQEFTKAEEMVNKILTVEPENQEILLLFGQVLYAQNKKDECINLVHKLSDNSENAELWNFCGLLEDYQGNYNKACKHLQKAIKLDPNNDKYYYNLANMYFKQGDTTYAKRYYNLAISLNPHNPNYHFALANLYYSEKHYKRALEELPEDLFEASLLKVIILYDTGYLALAKQELNRLFEQCPDNSILQEYNDRINKELGLN